MFALYHYDNKPRIYSLVSQRKFDLSYLSFLRQQNANDNTEVFLSARFVAMDYMLIDVITHHLLIYDQLKVHCVCFVAT